MWRAVKFSVVSVEEVGFTKNKVLRELWPGSAVVTLGEGVSVRQAHCS